MENLHLLKFTGAINDDFNGATGLSLLCCVIKNAG